LFCVPFLSPGLKTGVKIRIYMIYFLSFAGEYQGVPTPPFPLREMRRQAEIIPTIPDPDNTGVGTCIALKKHPPTIRFSLINKQVE
jgi:hypothetical protein